MRLGKEEERGARERELERERDGHQRGLAREQHGERLRLEMEVAQQRREHERQDHEAAMLR